MGRAPEMVAGPGRFTTRLIQATGGRVIGKEGAEGLYAVAVRGPVALGLALKVADGGERCRDGAVLDLLRLTGCLSAAELGGLEDLHRPERRNHRGIVVGRIEPDLLDLELED
jgi:L-asparaginase II